MLAHAGAIRALPALVGPRWKAGGRHLDWCIHSPPCAGVHPPAPTATHRRTNMYMRLPCVANHTHP